MLSEHVRTSPLHPLHSLAVTFIILALEFPLSRVFTLSSVLKYHLEFTIPRHRRTSSHDSCRYATIHALALHTSRASRYLTPTESLTFRTLFVFLPHGSHRLPTEEAVPNAGSTLIALVIYGLTPRLFTSHLVYVTPTSVALQISASIFPG